MPLRAMNGKKSARQLLIVGALLLAALQIEGCYYMQAIRGQFEVMNRRHPIPEVIADEEAPEDLRKRLAIVQEAGVFAVDELLLADNESYRSYADLGRDYVVWNVFAAPEFSLEPKTWCYPVAGCVAYRGYFAEEAARKKAQRLRANGFDVAVSGVSAYSTLGKFSDPVLNTMMRWPDTQLVATIFHELAHQKLYVKGDTAFNESFATAVADIGIKRWLEGRDELPSMEGFLRNRELRQLMMVLVDEAKTELQVLYESDLDAELQRSRKLEILDGLSTAAARLVQDNDSGAVNWLAAPLNNARLVSLGLYEGRQDAFNNIFRKCNEQLDCFYAETRQLADLDKDERHRRLDEVAD